MALKDSEGALASYGLALKAGPTSTDALFNRANALMSLKRFEEAAEDCENLLKLDPEFKYTRGFLAFFRLQSCDCAIWIDKSAKSPPDCMREARDRSLCQCRSLTKRKRPIVCARVCIADRYP